jgi:sporulation protein YlmC with PRC-barrel domain
MHPTIWTAVVCLLGWSWAAAKAQEVPSPRSIAQAQQQRAANSARTGPIRRCSQLVGLPIRNPRGEELGKIEDLLLDFESGRIHYVAISSGGFLGLGDKLFAVPWKSIRLRQGAEKERAFGELNISKQKMEAAPGFPKDQWPDLDNPRWSEEIDRYYGAGAQRASPSSARG